MSVYPSSRDTKADLAAKNPLRSPASIVSSPLRRLKLKLPPSSFNLFTAVMRDLITSKAIHCRKLWLYQARRQALDVRATCSMRYDAVKSFDCCGR